MYNEIYREWLQAKLKGELNLDKDFNKKTREYLNSLLKMVPIKEGLLKKIYEEKILNLTFILSCIENSYNSEFIKKENNLNQKIETDKKEKLKNEKETFKDTLNKNDSLEPKYLIIRIRESIPTIVGSDLKTYGPFNPEDIAAIPIKNANILIQKGAAVQINWGNKNENG